MDRNVSEDDDKRLALIKDIRKKIYEKKNIMYLYLSSTNIYSMSSKKICEDGEIGN